MENIYEGKSAEEQIFPITQYFLLYFYSFFYFEFWWEKK